MEKMTDIELEGIRLTETKPRSLGRIESTISKEDDVETALGSVHVIVQGDQKKMPIITYHDIGLNSTTCFQGFFNHPDMQPILKHFCVYHINAPGQHEGALPLPQGSGRFHFHHHGIRYQYPTMDQLADMILPVMQFYGLKHCIGFGVGAGANVLSRFALMHPDKVEGLVLVNCASGKAGWSEWGYQKLNSWWLRGGNISTQVEDYLLWHWCGSHTMYNNHDLTMVYSEYIKSINPQNLSHFIESYIKRTDLGIVREMDPLKKKSAKNFECQVMLVGGDYSPHLNDVVHMNSRLDPANSTWIKFDCGGMVLEEAPEKLAESFRLFLQGMGYVPAMSQTRIVEARGVASRDSHALGGVQGNTVTNANAVC